jgi:hypothetical protein
MNNIFIDSYQARKTLREIKILRKLSRIPNNLFTTALLDIILPEGILLNQVHKKPSPEEQKDNEIMASKDSDLSKSSAAVDKQ